MNIRIFPLLILSFSLISCGGGNDESPDVGNTKISGEFPDDPAPEFNAGGEYRCSDCPDSDIFEFSENLSDVTSKKFTGNVRNAIGNGEYFLSFKDGRAISGTLQTNQITGDYSLESPLFCGDQLLKFVWENASGKYVVVKEISTDNCVEPDIRVVLTWDDIGIDWELHLVKEGGKINDAATDCTWFSCISSSPDWGVVGVETDNPKKDVDNTGSFGPENIFLANPEEDSYTVMVEHWNSSGSSESDGRIIILTKSESKIFNIQDLAPWHVWSVATIESSTGKVSSINTVIDCSASWSSGCVADIP